jgi:hypothetical protein
MGDLCGPQHCHAIFRLCGEDLRDQALCIAQGSFSQFGLPEVGSNADALDAAHTQEGGAQFKRQAWVVVSSCRKPLKIVPRHIHDLLPNLSASRYASKIPLDIEKLVGKAADLIEPPFRYMSRVLRDEESRGQEQHRQTCR